MKTLIILEIILVLLFTNPWIRGGQNSDWAGKVLNNPEEHFSGSYERAIFQKFLRKFPDAKLEKAVEIDNYCLLHFNSISTDDSYQLLLKKNGDKVNSALRNLYQSDSETVEQTELQWIGKLLYRLDSGDSAAALDMLFYDKVTVHYKDLKNKSGIISQIMTDFPQVVRVRNISITETDEILHIRIETTQLTSLLLELPKELTIPIETVELQKDLHDRIRAYLSNDDKSAMRPFSFRDFQNFYPGAKLYGDTLIVPYPRTKIRDLAEIKYVLDKKSRNQKGSFLSVVSLRYDAKNSTLFLNNSHPIQFYGSKNIDDSRMSCIAKIMEFLYNTFVNSVSEEYISSFKKVDGKFQYRGYNIEVLSIDDFDRWIKLWQGLSEEGSIYLYPVAIEDKGNSFQIKWLLYIISKTNKTFYHFGELSIGFQNTDCRKTRNVKVTDFTLVFYPYLHGLSVTE